MGTQGWAALGKPDFSTAAKLFYRIPANIREGLNRSEEKVLIWTIFFTWTTSYRSGRQSTLCSFSQIEVGLRFGRSRWTVARALESLKELGLVWTKRRKPRPDGTFQTNLLALGARLSALLALHTPQTREKSPCSKSAPQEVENVYKSPLRASLTGALEGILEKTRKKDVHIDPITRELFVS